MYSRPTSPMIIGQVLDRAFDLTLRSFSRVWLLALLAALASLSASVYQFSRGVPTQEAILWRGDWIYWAIYACGVLTSLLLVGTIYLRQHAIANGEDARGKLKVSLARLPVVFVGAILFVACVLLGGVLLLVPGLILVVSLLFFQLMILIEKKGPVSALRDSHELVWGRWWRTATLLTVGAFIVAVMYFALGFVVGLIAPFIAGNDPLLTTLTSIALLLVVVECFGTPFFSAVLISVYYDLKLRREGADLVARIGALPA